MDRRRYLRRLGAVGGALGAGALGGCLGGFGSANPFDANPNVELPEPDREYDSEDVAFPAWGQRVPDVSFRDPLSETRVAFRDVDRPFFVTFFFTHCRTVCPPLVSALRNLQADSLPNGYADEVRFLPVTFDPARDDGERFRTYAEEMNVSLDAGNWSFLRPADEKRAKEVINGEFSVGFERQPMEGSDGYMFGHLPLILLGNADGYVERAYTEQSPDAARLIEDFRRVR